MGRSAAPEGAVRAEARRGRRVFARRWLVPRERSGVHPQEMRAGARIALKSLTLVRVGPVTIRSPNAENTE